jgi:vancomycin resistance protein YoaR
MSKRIIPFAAIFVFTQSAALSIFLTTALPDPAGKPSEIYSGFLAQTEPYTVQQRSMTNDNVTLRLQKRLLAQTSIGISVENAADALDQKRKMQNGALTASFSVSGSSVLATPSNWSIRVSEHPEWIRPQIDFGILTFRFDEKSIALSFDSYLPSGFVRPGDAVALPSDDDSKFTVIGTPHAGFIVDPPAAAHAIVAALESEKTTVVLQTNFDAGRLFVKDENGMKQYSLLSGGKSNFSDSPLGRSANVRKALNEHLNGYVIPPSAVFSFNETLNGSVDTGNGWFNSLIIVNGKDLVQAPGGGICQAATTAFRATVLAGLPVLDRANHSLYVTHYKDYGIGIDATIFPGKQDLKAVNDTGNPIVLLARSVGDDAYVDMYGIPDGRKVLLDGPFFSTTAGDDMTFHGLTLAKNEIGWKQVVQYSDGRLVATDIVSRYLSLPRSLASEYAIPRGKQELQTLAESASTGSTLAMR